MLSAPELRQRVSAALAEAGTLSQFVVVDILGNSGPAGYHALRVRVDRARFETAGTAVTGVRVMPAIPDGVRTDP
jgi:hypothetical protein